MQRKLLKVGDEVALSWGGDNLSGAVIQDLPESGLVTVQWMPGLAPTWSTHSAAGTSRIKIQLIACKWSEREEWKRERMVKKASALAHATSVRESAHENAQLLCSLFEQMGYTHSASGDFHCKARSRNGVRQPFMVVSTQALMELAAHHPDFVAMGEDEQETALDNLL